MNIYIWMSSVIKGSSICSSSATNIISECLSWGCVCYAVAYCFSICRRALERWNMPFTWSKPSMVSFSCFLCNALVLASFLTLYPGHVNMLNLEAIRGTVALGLHCECKWVPSVGKRQVIVPLRDKFNECSYLWVCIWFRSNCYSSNVCTVLCYSRLCMNH